VRYESPAGNVLSAPLNKVTVRYDLESDFVLTEGVVRPTVRRVLDHMQAANVLSTSKAATRSRRDAQRESEVAITTMRQYASLLGEDDEVEEALAEGEQVLQAMAAPSASFGVAAKAVTHDAMRRHRGSKNFDQT
jgi:hypothetical protein